MPRTVPPCKACIQSSRQSARLHARDSWPCSSYAQLQALAACVARFQPVLGTAGFPFRPDSIPLPLKSYSTREHYAQNRPI